MTSVQALLDESSLILPDEHRVFLSAANGVAGFHGYVRLFGIECETCVDLRWWNEQETWKFAWKKDLGAFVCFGETAWGDQYAYRREDLASGVERVFLLDAFEMEAEAIAETFRDFMQGEFIRAATEPYDAFILEAYRRFGPLNWSDHITYIPSLHLGGEERAQNIHRLNGRASMIINGDLWSELSMPTGGALRAVETFTDDLGRTRTRIVWGEK